MMDLDYINNYSLESIQDYAINERAKGVDLLALNPRNFQALRNRFLEQLSIFDARPIAPQVKRGAPDRFELAGVTFIPVQEGNKQQWIGSENSRLFF